MTAPQISGLAVPGPRDRLKICFGNKSHVEHLATLIVFMVINLGIAMHWSIDTMGVSTIISIGARDMTLIIFYAEELL